MIHIRLPNITGKTEQEQLTQIKSYLYQLAQDLNWALSTMESGSGAAADQKISTGNFTSGKEDA